MEIKQNLKYLESHEWADVNGNKVKVGITDFAQNELGDNFFADGRKFHENDMARLKIRRNLSTKTLSAHGLSKSRRKACPKTLSTRRLMRKSQNKREIL